MLALALKGDEKETIVFFFFFGGGGDNNNSFTYTGYQETNENLFIDLFFFNCFK